MLAEEDNINRTLKINGGIYTAKAKEGRYIHGDPPYGYRITGEGKNKHLIIQEEEALVVRYMFDAYIKNVPIYLISQHAKSLGFKHSGNSAIIRLISKPIYIAMQEVKAFKEYPGGLFPAKHEPIIDLPTWQLAQQKLSGPRKEPVAVEDELPLRGVIKCHCGNMLTGAPSRGKMGKYYYYYKCRAASHLNVSAIKLHEQMGKIQDYMSLPSRIISNLLSKSEEEFDKKFKSDKMLLTAKKRELAEEENKLLSIEEKWVTNKITHDTYERWYRIITGNKISIKALIEQLSADKDVVFNLVKRNIEKLQDIGYFYKNCNTIEKQQLLKIEFDTNLYYQNGMYRTPTMLDCLSHNSQIMRKKGLLDYQKKRGKLNVLPSGGAAGSRTLVRKWNGQAFYTFSYALVFVVKQAAILASLTLILLGTN